MRAVIRSKSLRAVLHGEPLGHPAHPLLVQVPLGAWISASMLDLVPGGGRPARHLVGAGLLASGGAIAAGVVDWSDLDPEQQRTGWVHAAINTTALALYAASWRDRRNGRTGRGKLLGFAGLLVVSGGGWLGGHLAYRQRAGVSRHGEVPFSEDV
ncbi:DUF2231 domain-containing protein [Curtobacterium ammoniigenes]|uniref:DUF2231 domain-containing protein n=1 Tax=Curtobacterium ammoniigenes TaxID=395387 RepID=UPI000831F810|nr:DUF2231 domain-containing protein [Curtobacterium ammoniigenes]